MNWTRWREHFERNRTRPLPPIGPQTNLTAPVASAVASSLAKFQVGEAGEGRIVRQLARCRLPEIDLEYRQALALFVAEEGRHARVLAAAVRVLGGQLLSTTWSERVFVFGRRLCGVRLKLLVLLAAEVIGIAFYGLLASRLPIGDLRAALAELVGDEADHLRFHQDFFRTQASPGWRRLVFGASWLLVGHAAALVVLWDHRRTLRMLGVPLLATADGLSRLVCATARLGSGVRATIGSGVAAVPS